MGLLSWLRECTGRAPDDGGAREERRAGAVPPNGGCPAPGCPAGEWEELPAYLPVDPCEHRAACVIASAIAAGERSDCQLVVRSVKMANPEHALVSCIASALAAGALESSSFTVRRIYKHKDMESEHAA